MEWKDVIKCVQKWWTEMKVMKSSKIMKMSEFSGDQKVGSKWPPQNTDVGTLNDQKEGPKVGPIMNTCSNKSAFLASWPKNQKVTTKLVKTQKSWNLSKSGTTFWGSIYQWGLIKLVMEKPEKGPTFWGQKWPTFCPEFVNWQQCIDKN